MDRRRTDAADGGRALRRDRRTRKLAVVVAVQNVLVAACLLVTLYVYLDVHGRASADDVHIQFNAIPAMSDNETLQVGHIFSSNMMGLVHKKNDVIYVNCTGPYLLYMYVCYKSMDEKESRVVLQLQVVGSTPPVSSITLNASQEVYVCSGVHSVAYLKAKEEASLHMYSTDGFKIKNMTVGLSYLLGKRCEF